MSSTATLREESSQIGTLSSSIASSTGEVVFHEFGAARPLPLPNTTSLASLLGEFESEPAIAGHLADARHDLSQTLYADEPETLSAMRLAAGLSQAQLAARAGTTQPYIARIERGQADPSTDMIARIAEALNAEADLAFRAIRNQRNTRG